jgi:hypothetical protein
MSVARKLAMAASKANYVYHAPNYGTFGSYMPDNSTTGHITPRAQLSPYNASGTTLTITSDNQLFESLEIFGDIVIKAKNTIFQDCLFRGPLTWPSNDGAIIACTDAAGVNTLVQDCTFEPILPNYYRNAMIGAEYTALRCRSYWVNDHYGVYSYQTPRNTNVKIAGCYMTDNVYWHGTSTTDTSLPTYPSQNTDPISVTLPSGSVITVPAYPIKPDGSHNDGIQIQGGLGGSKSIWCIGNNVHVNTWKEGDEHPTGLLTPIPVTMGTQDCPKWRQYKNDSPFLPMLSGQYSSNGQAILIQQNTYQFPQIDTVVVENNWCNATAAGIVATAHGGGYTTIQATVKNNYLGENWYQYNAGNPSIYPIRVDYQADATIEGLNVSGVQTNRWYEGHWGTVGASLTVGKTAGIVYDH